MSNPENNTETLPPDNLAVTIYHFHADAEATFEGLQQSDCNTLKLSIVDQFTEIRCDRWGHQFAGINGMGILEISVPRYESALKVDKIIAIAQGTAKNVTNGRKMISRTNPESIDEHQPSPAEAWLGLSV